MKKFDLKEVREFPEYGIKILNSGSDGNCTIWNNVMIDCGIAFKRIKPHLKNITLLIITHIHGDHLNPSSLNRILEKRGMVVMCNREVYNKWIWYCNNNSFLQRRLDKFQVLENEQVYQWDVEHINTTVNTYPVMHGSAGKPVVRNIAVRLSKIDKPGMVFCTDTGYMQELYLPREDKKEQPAFDRLKGQDIYLLEANHVVDVIEERIRRKTQNDELVIQETCAMINHTNLNTCIEVYEQLKREDSKLVQMHISSTNYYGDEEEEE